MAFDVAPANYINRSCMSTFMGLDSFTFSLDWIKHAFLVLTAVLMLFLIVKAASGDAFWMRYQTKDLGLLLDASHGVRGDVTMNYDKLSWRDHFDYNVTPTALLLRQTQHSQWRFRQRYATTLDGPKVEPNLLLDPSGLYLRKNGDTITLTTDATNTTSCPTLDAPARSAVIIHITGDSPLVTKKVQQLATTKQPPRLTLSINVMRDPAAKHITLGATGDPRIGDALVCRLAQSLSEFPLETSATSSGAADTLSLTITHPNTPGFTDEKLAAAILKALEVFP